MHRKPSDPHPRGRRPRAAPAARAGGNRSRDRRGGLVIAVIFEVWPAEGRHGDYLDIAAHLRPHLATVDGFLSIERFTSLSEPGKILSLSFWRDEAAIEAWRNRHDHRCAQAQGRAGIFRDYRLCIAGAIRSYGMNDRDQAPRDSRAYLEAPI